MTLKRVFMVCIMGLLFHVFPAVAATGTREAAIELLASSGDKVKAMSSDDLSRVFEGAKNSSLMNPQARQLLERAAATSPFVLPTSEQATAAIGATLRALGSGDLQPNGPIGFVLGFLIGIAESVAVAKSPYGEEAIDDAVAVMLALMVVGAVAVPF